MLEGGGVKGLGTAGAVMGLLDAGWTFPRVAGTSVGALAAAFAAAGADSATFRDALGRLDLRQIPDRRVPLPLLSESVLAGRPPRRLRRRLDPRVAAARARPARRAHVRRPPPRRRRGRSRARDAGSPLQAGGDGHRRHERPAAAAALGLPAVRPRPRRAARRRRRPDVAVHPVLLPARAPCGTRTPATTATIVDGGVLSNFAIEIFDRTDGRPNRAGRRSASACCPTCRPGSATSSRSSACRCCRPCGCSSRSWRPPSSAATRRTWSAPASATGR